jgi:hypothetical protein
MLDDVGRTMQRKSAKTMTGYCRIQCKHDKAFSSNWAIEGCIPMTRKVLRDGAVVSMSLLLLHG